MYSSVIVFTSLCNSYLHPSPEPFPYCKTDSLYPLNNTPFSPLSCPWKPPFYFLSLWSWWLWGHLTSRNIHVCCDWLISLSITFSKVIILRHAKDFPSFLRLKDVSVWITVPLCRLGNRQWSSNTSLQKISRVARIWTQEGWLQTLCSFYRVQLPLQRIYECVAGNPSHLLEPPPISCHSVIFYGMKVITPKKVYEINPRVTPQRPPVCYYVCLFHQEKKKSLVNSPMPCLFKGTLVMSCPVSPQCISGEGRGWGWWRCMGEAYVLSKADQKPVGMSAVYC